MSADEQSGHSLPVSARRSFMKKAALGVGALAFGITGSGSAGASTTRHGISFDNVVNLVDDFGADPTGSEPVDSAVENAAAADTLVMVPDGEYRFSGEVLVSPAGNVGFLAEDGASPRFVAPAGHNDHLLNVYHLPRALFEGIDIDIREADTTAGLRFDIEDQVHVEDVEFLGRGTHPDSRVTNALDVAVTNATGTGTIRNVRALKGSAIGHYKSGDGRVGVFVGRANVGTVRIEDCHLEEFGNNGLYCSRTTGAVEVVGGTYRNNNVSGVRIGGSASYVDGAVVEVDLGSYTGPTTRMDKAYNTRCIVLEQNNVTKTPGATIRDADLRIASADNSQAAVHFWGWTGETAGVISNTRIQVDEGGVPAVYAEDSQLTMDGVSLTGSAIDRRAMVIEGTAASGSAVTNSCIEQTGDNRDGCLVRDATDCTVSDSNINVTGQEIVTENATVSTSNLTSTDSCPLPQIGLSASTGSPSHISGSSATVTGTLSDLGGAESVDVSFEWGLPGSGLPNATARQTLSETGTVEADLTGLEPAQEYVYRIAAEASTGQSVAGDTASFTTSDLEHTISIEGGSKSDKVKYELEVSGDLQKSTADGATIDSNDKLSGDTATGQVAGGADSYDFSGRIVRFRHDGPLTITLDGQSFPASKWLNLPNALQFDGTTADTQRSYEFAVSDALAADPTVGSVNVTDDIGETSVSGQVAGGVDAFRYAGEIKTLATEEDISVSLEDTDA